MTNPPSPEQVSYVRGLQKRLHLPNAILDNHCVEKFRKPFAQLDRREMVATPRTDDLVGAVAGRLDAS